MQTLYVATIHAKLKSGKIKPRAIGLRKNGETKIIHLYRDGESKPLGDILKNVELIKDIILKTNKKQDIVINDFDRAIDDFDLPIDNREYNVYNVDFHFETDKSEREHDAIKINQILDVFEKQTKKPYKKLVANAAVVYKYLERRGILQNYSLQYPKWSLQTWSGRSKCLNFNVQGWHENDHIRPPNSNDTDVLIHFDWICADIRVASLMSKDKILEKSFQHSDPYTTMEILINKNSEDKLTRDECKLFLLKSINSFDISSQALSTIYRGLGNWIYKQGLLIKNGEALTTILDKQFKINYAKNKRAMLNGVMQGSVAHAMHNTFRRVWEKLPENLVSEIHDSLVVSCSRDPATIKAIIQIVSEIMTRPFAGYLDSNPFFPIKVSIGDRWKEWDHRFTYYEDRIVYAQEQTEDSEEQDRKDKEDEEEKEAEAGEAGKICREIGED